MLSELVRETLAHVWKTLQPLEVPVAILDGASLTVWGHGRFTKDVDLILSVKRSDIDQVVDALKEARVFSARLSSCQAVGGRRSYPI